MLSSISRTRENPVTPMLYTNTFVSLSIGARADMDSCAITMMSTEFESSSIFFSSISLCLSIFPFSYSANASLQRIVVISISFPDSFAVIFSNHSEEGTVVGSVASNPIFLPFYIASSIIGRSICWIGVLIMGLARSAAKLKVEHARKMRPTPASSRLCAYWANLKSGSLSQTHG